METPLYYPSNQGPVPGRSPLSDFHASLPAGVRVRGPVKLEFASILTPEAVAFVASLARQFRDRIDYILEQRNVAQAGYDAGELPGFAPETSNIRQAEWKCAPTPPALADRRVEITGPVDRKMVINALNSGARCFMARVQRPELAPCPC